VKHDFLSVKINWKVKNTQLKKLQENPKKTLDKAEGALYILVE
jgi:hypothetical protein